MRRMHVAMRVVWMRKGYMAVRLLKRAGQGYLEVDCFRSVGVVVMIREMLDEHGRSLIKRDDGHGGYGAGVN